MTVLIKLHIIAIDIQGNKLNCNRLPHRIRTYDLDIIPHFYANKIKLVLYDQLSFVDIYDSNIFLQLESQTTLSKDIINLHFPKT